MLSIYRATKCIQKTAYISCDDLPYEKESINIITIITNIHF